MKILNTFPPNYKEIKEVFPDVESYKPVFCFGDVVHNPFNIQVKRDLEIHEAVHSKQQGSEPALWWDRYLKDVEFRLSQEVEAYAFQLKYIKSELPERIYRFFLDKISEMLSSSMYGNIISKSKAETKVRKYMQSL